MNAPQERPPVECSTRIKASPEAIFAVLADSEGMSQWSGLGTFKVVLPGKPGEHGVGEERMVKTPVGMIREQIIESVPARSIKYRIIEGSPFEGYVGEVRLTPQGNETEVVWTVRFRSRIPCTNWLFRFAMQRSFTKALAGLKKKIAA